MESDPSYISEHRPLALPSDEIHLWLVFYDQISDERLHHDYRELLNPEERGQELRFYFARDRRRYLVTRALVRTVLSRYVPIPPRDWIFSTNAYGRPEISHPAARDACLSFNVSHTHSLIVLGVARGRIVGVDVENLREREPLIDIADRFFAPPEVAALAALPPEGKPFRFFEYWTCKESYIKARGMGLSLPLDKFSFHYASERSVTLATDSELADDPARWRFWQFRLAPDYLMAVCAERAGKDPTRLVFRQSVPLLSEAELPLNPLRTSP